MTRPQHNNLNMCTTKLSTKFDPYLSLFQINYCPFEDIFRKKFHLICARILPMCRIVRCTSTRVVVISREDRKKGFRDGGNRIGAEAKKVRKHN